MSRKTAVKITIAVLAVLLSVSGCNEGGPSARVYVKSGSAKRLRVAVLPFDNVSKDQDAGRVITNTIMTYLLSTGEFDVVEPGIVFATMGSENVRVTEGVTVEVAQKLQPKLNVDAYIMGMVEEYGEVRIGADTYPSISFSARLVDGHNANILWAATISKTGADGVKVFDIGRVSSLGKLSKQAVAAMAASLYNSRSDIMKDMTLPSDNGTTPDIIKVRNGEKPTDVALRLVQPAPTIPAAAATALSAKYDDESATYGEKELTALLKDIGDSKLGPVSYQKHYHEWVETTYLMGTTGRSAELKLVDYRNKAASAKYVQLNNSGLQQTTFETMPAFAGDSDFGYYHLDISVGRFGVFLRGPKANKDNIEAVGRGIIALLK